MSQQSEYVHVDTRIKRSLLDEIARVAGDERMERALAEIVGRDVLTAAAKRERDNR